MPRRADNSMNRITPEEACRAIYFDFEGLVNEPPSLVGFLVEEEFRQWVLDSQLGEAAIDRDLEVCSLDEAVNRLVHRCENEQRVLVAFTTAEMQRVSDHAPRLLPRVKVLYRNANKIVRRWMRPAREQLKAESSAHPGLKDYSAFLGKPYPSHYGDRRATRRIRYARHRPVTRAGRRHWTILLDYNRFDCESLRWITLAAANEAPPERGLFDEDGWEPPC